MTGAGQPKSAALGADKLNLSALVHGDGKIDQVVGGNVVSIVDERRDGAAKFQDCFFEFLSLRRVDH